MIYSTVMRRKNLIIGIDIGGTKIKGAVVDYSGNILCEKTIQTEATQGKNHVIKNIIRLINDLAGDGQISKIGIGTPGPVIKERGIVINPPNLPGWGKVNLKAIIEKGTGLKVLIDNDAKCAALAELKFGAGRKYSDFIYVTVSTGIGGGIVINKKVFRGAYGSAGEIGHIPIDMCGQKCGCGMVGDLESMASGRAFLPDPIQVEKAARKNEKWALDEIDKVAKILGRGFAGLVNVLNPEAIIVGGGISNMGELLLKPVRKYLKEYALPYPGSKVKVIRAKLGKNSGVIGAAALWL